MAFTKSAKLFAKDQLREFGELYTLIIITILLFAAPISVWIGLNSDEIVRILFMRGEFDEKMHTLVAHALVGLVPSIIFMGASQILSNGFYVMNKIRVPAVVMPSAVVVYLLCVRVLYETHGVFGLAIATSVWAFFMFCALTILLRVMMEWFSATHVFFKLLFYVGVAVVTFWPTVVATNWMISNEIARLFTSLIIGCAIYAVLLAIVRDRGFLYVKDKVGLRRKT